MSNILTIKIKMRHLDLFSGIGGFSLAASWVWGNMHDLVCFCERDKYCQNVLKKHWPDVPCVDDIHNLRGENIGTIDLLTGGFPCQPFSLAGKRAGQQDDRYLWPEMLRIIKETRPRWVIGENVPGIISMALDEVLADLEGEGYEVQSFIVPACAVNAPHRRDRVWIIANNAKQFDRSYHPESMQRQIQQPGERYSTATVADAIRTGLEEWGSLRGDTQQELKAIERSCRGIGTDADQQHGNCGRLRASEVSQQQASRVSSGQQWQSEPGIRRVDDGVSHRVDRLRGLGNAIVPQVAAQFFQFIKQIDSLTKPFRTARHTARGGMSPRR